MLLITIEGSTMKKAIFFIFIASILTAQTPAYRHPFSQKKIPYGQDIQNMVRNQALNRTSNLVFDQSGRPTITDEQLWNGSAWVNSTRMEYQYALAKTKAGSFVDILNIFHFAWDGVMWVASGDETWTYDAQGNLVEIFTRRSNGNPHHRFIYTGPFNANGDAAGFTDEYHNGIAWTNSWRETYTYDANGCIIEEVWEYWDDGSWILDQRIQKYYSQACCPERYVRSGRRHDSNSWDIAYITAFTYGSCMTDMVPYSYFWTNWRWLYTCNPTVILMGNSSDGVSMSSPFLREEYSYINCLAMTYTMYSNQVLTQVTNYTYDSYLGKMSSAYDNSNQRMTSQVTQVNGVNTTKTLYAYEGLDTHDLPTESDVGIPLDFSLKQNYPNPFNPSTTITFDLSKDSNVKISIYDTSGRLIRELVDHTMTVGSQTINWDGKDESGNPVSGGVYLYNLHTGNYNQTKKMVLMK